MGEKIEELEYTIPCFAAPNNDSLKIREVPFDSAYFPFPRLSITVKQAYPDEDGAYVIFTEEKVDELITALLYWKETKCTQ